MMKKIPIESRKVHAVACADEVQRSCGELHKATERHELNKKRLEEAITDLACAAEYPADSTPERSGTCGAPGNRCEWMAGALCEPRREGHPFLERNGRDGKSYIGFAGTKWFIEFCPGCGKKLEFT